MDGFHKIKGNGENIQFKYKYLDVADNKKNNIKVTYDC